MLYNVASHFEAQTTIERCIGKMKPSVATLLVLTVLIACLITTGYSQGSTVTTEAATTSGSDTGTTAAGSSGNKSDKNTAASFSASFTIVTVAVTGAAVLFSNLR